MNKKLLSLLLFVIAAFTSAFAQETLTVYEGTNTSSYVPAYVSYWDDFSRSQVVIPAADLDAMTGGTISAIKFYTSAQNIPYTSVATADVYLMEVDYTTINAFEPKANATVVYQGTFDFVAVDGGGEVTIEFATPYQYAGGNLLIGIENTTDAGYKFMYFYGQTVEGASVAGSHASSVDNAPATQRNFIPQTTFTYTPTGGVIVPKPTNLQVSNITPNSATVSWTAGGDETSWDVEYKKATEETWTTQTVTTPTIELDALANGTEYNVHVRAIDGENTSAWVATSFVTPRCDPAEMGEITYSLIDSYGDGWNGASIQVVNATTGLVVETLTIATGSLVEGTIGICPGETLNFVWVSGNYDSECSYTITDPYGEEIASNSFSGTVGSYTYEIITNPKPKNLAVDNITQTTADATWTGQAEAYNLRYRTKAGFEKFYEYGFEDGLSGWSFGDNDGDGASFEVMKMTNYNMGGVPMTTADGGDYAMASTSLNSSSAYIACDNLLISPQLDLQGTLKFFASDLGANYIEHFSVLVSTTGTDMASFTALAENVATPGGLNNWVEYSYDLSAYEGQQGYIAIRHQGSGTSGYYLFVDAVSLDGAEIPEGEWVVMENVTSPATMEGLTPSTDYEVQVQAVYEEENSDWTASVDFTTLGLDVLPTGLTVSNETATTADVDWAGPQEAYNLRYRTAAVNYGVVDDFTSYPNNSVPTGWTTIDADGDGNNWYVWVLQLEDGTTQTTLSSNSYINNVGALTPDNWIYTPETTLGATLSFDAWGQDPTYPAEHFQVYVSTTGTAVADFVAVSEEFVATGTPTTYTIDLGAYAGQQGYVALRHFNCSDEYILNVSNFYMAGEQEDVPAGEWTVVENVTPTYTIEGLTPETEYEVQVQGIYDAKAVTEWTASVFFTTLEAPVVPEYSEFYIVGTFNDWNKEENGGRIELVANEDETEFTGTVELEANAEFKIITPDETATDGWKYFGGEDANQVGFFLINNDMLNINITLVDGSNFRVDGAGEYSFTVKAGSAKGVQEPLVMTVTKTSTGIATIGVDGYDNNAWYNLNGQKLNGKPAVPGIYINGNKKVVIK